MKSLYDNVSLKVSKLVTNTYSTSFSIGIRSLGTRLHDPIYAIYGFVRLADEIVDSFLGYEQRAMLEQLEKETYQAIETKISLNPILNSFQHVVNTYNIDHELIHQFLESMKMDLVDRVYTQEDYDLYILGSAEVVGLMCLKVFCDGNEEQYQELKYPAQKLGAAFQKINFLRDFKSDFYELKRMYFPNVDFNHFDMETKLKIEEEIAEDFRLGLEGIKRLPKDARFGTYIAYRYYIGLLDRIKKTSPEELLNSNRVRVPNGNKYSIFFACVLKRWLYMI